MNEVELDNMLADINVEGNKLTCIIHFASNITEDEKMILMDRLHEIILTNYPQVEILQFIIGSDKEV